MAINWPDGVNKKIYGMEISETENVIYLEFESGKARTRRKNSLSKGLFSFMLSFEDIGIDSEFKKFEHWWKNNLQSGALAFLFDNLSGVGTKEYRPTGPYTAIGQKRKEVAITVEEL